MTQRFLSPEVLASISGLDLVAKTVVEGFIAGLHRSPDFGFSQEFAEYRSYNPGDDLRHVDWNVFARSEKMYLKRYRGETNTLVTILLDQSASMKFGSHAIRKLDFSRFLAASIAYLASGQRDAIGLVVFDDEVRNYIQPSGRQGQLHRVMHAIETRELRSAHQLCQAVRALHGVPAPPRIGGRDFGFLRGAAEDHRSAGAPRSARQ